MGFIYQKKVLCCIVANVLIPSLLQQRARGEGSEPHSKARPSGLLLGLLLPAGSVHHLLALSPPQSPGMEKLGGSTWGC